MEMTVNHKNVMRMSVRTAFWWGMGLMSGAGWPYLYRLLQKSDQEVFQEDLEAIGEDMWNAVKQAERESDVDVQLELFE